MALDPVQHGTPNNVDWGTNGLSLSYGRIVSGGRTKGVKSDPSLNNDGVPTGDVCIKEMIKYDFDMETNVNETLPTEGGLINIAGDVNCVVASVAEAWKRGARKGVKVTAHGFPA